MFSCVAGRGDVDASETRPKGLSPAKALGKGAQSEIIDRVYLKCE